MVNVSDYERLVRVFSDALEVVGGVTVFRGVPFSGVGIVVGSTGECEMFRYSEGVLVGVYHEPIFDIGQSLIVFDDLSETVLVEEEEMDVRFLGEPFTGFAVERSEDDPVFQGQMSQFDYGRSSHSYVEWFPSGSLSSLTNHLASERFAYLIQRFKWHPNGSLSSSRVNVAIDGFAHTFRTMVEFDEVGVVTRALVDYWTMGDEHLPVVRELASDRLFLSGEDFADLEFCPQLELDFVCLDSVEPGITWLLESAVLEDVVELKTGAVIAHQFARLLELPRLQTIELTDEVPDNVLDLVKSWQAAKPGRVLKPFQKQQDS